MNGELERLENKYSTSPGWGNLAQGMTLRDYFAAMAMQAYCSSDEWRLTTSQDETADFAYAMADAMLEARKE